MSQIAQAVEAISQALCRVYTIPCPACSSENQFPRLKPDIVRVISQEPDGHPLESKWRTDGDFPEWITPLNYFWAICSNCGYTGQVDDADFRQWKKKGTTKFLSQYEGTLEQLEESADSKESVVQKLLDGIRGDDLYGSLLCQFFLGIYSECLKTVPVAGVIGRAYLRIAWIYRDRERLYSDFTPSSKIQDLLDEASPTWKSELPSNSSSALPPEIVTDEITALRHALANFEGNFSTLQEAGHEDEMRLMTLIADIGFRIYELTALDEDFTVGQGYFSGVMQKSLSIVNDKSIVGGAVNRAKDTLEKAGDRGRELRALKDKYEKEPPDTAITNGAAPPPTSPPESEAQPEPAEEETEAETEASTPEASGPQINFSLPAGSDSLAALQQEIVQLGEENKRWMRLAGISDITGLPNRVMLARVLLPGAFKQAAAHKEPLGCILISPEGLREINGKYGRLNGDAILKKFSDCLKELIRKGERLCHLEGVNFAVVVPRALPHQLGKRAEVIHKELTSRRFDMEGGALSLEVSIGVAGMETPNSKSTKALQDSLYRRSVEALDVAKLQGNHIEVNSSA